MSLDTKSSLKIIYYLMSVDGKIDNKEKETFNAIGNELDRNFKDDKASIIEECQDYLDRVIDEEDYYDIVKEGVMDVLENSNSSWYSTPLEDNVLIWNLLVIAFSNGSYLNIERNLIKYIVRRIEFDKLVYLEMENTIRTLYAIENEIKSIKTISKSYDYIQNRIEELSNRKSVIELQVAELMKG